MTPDRFVEMNHVYDRRAARRYREQDSAALAQGGSRRHYAQIIERLTASFDRPINVLDAGCGTGRYFHALRNVNRLVGVDISEHMIREARNPVARETLDVQTLELHVGDVAALDLPEGSFDFICSLGVVGEFAPIDAPLLERFARLLNDGGILFFTAVDTHSRTYVPRTRRTFARRAARRLFPYLPRTVQAAVNRRLAPHYVSETDLRERLEASPFERFTIERYLHPPGGGWAGAHFDVTAYRERP